ncbi:S41 family peptidase [Mucilaginibacter sp.]|uniref:S41 family peptidase n=1 Tax=Mucilaginibacter sp. TaxID=1882438 RepID=UPI003263CB98
MNSIRYFKRFNAFWLLLISHFLPIKVICQDRIINSTTSAVELERIADYGKIWGVVNYFHPEMGKGRVNGDSLFLKNIDLLGYNPSASNFKESISAMLAELNDPKTKIVEPSLLESKTVNISRTAFYRSSLPGKKLYLAVPQNVFTKLLTADSVLSNVQEKDILIDLRNNQINNDLGLKQYAFFVQPLIAGIIKSTMILPTERTFFYKGLMREDFPQDINLFDPDKDGNVTHLQVHNGFRNISEGAYLLANPTKDFSNHNYCFIINKYVNINSVKALMALRNRHLCHIVFDGVPPDYLYGTFYSMNLSDNLNAKIRVSEVIYEDGTVGTKADHVTQSTLDTTLNSPLIKSAVEVLTTNFNELSDKHIENTVFIRKPVNTYSTMGTPDTKLRLLGLFNFWNVIHFFSPNKNLISVDWDKALPYFISKFLLSNSDEKYFFSLMELTASIKDGHGILLNTKTGRSPKNIMDGNLPFACDMIKGKVYITSIMPDTLQNIALSKLKYGDEIIAIDSVPVKTIIKKWGKLLVASNNAGFNREFYATWFTAGQVGKSATISVSRNGQKKDIILKRIKRDDYYNLWGKVIRTPIIPSFYPPYCKVLNGNIGYMRLNRIYTSQLDSLANLLKNCKKIIIDARGYPRDANIGTELAAYIAKKTDTVSYDKFPFVTGPDVIKNQTLIDYSVIEANSNLNLKHQKYYILADEGNQSQSEWNIIALQGVTNATTIGRTTAGANGMAVTIVLPGDYITFFSGFGEYYMDNTSNQKNGIKIDIQIEKTLKGAIRGEDEILTKALSIVQK